MISFHKTISSDGTWDFEWIQLCKCVCFYLQSAISISRNYKWYFFAKFITKDSIQFDKMFKTNFSKKGFCSFTQIK